jgi:hypothetical protein
MREIFINPRCRTASITRTITRTALVSFLAFFLICPPAKADPLLVQTGITLHAFWLILAAGIAIESLILAAFTRRPIKECIVAWLPAAAITGFTGYVAILYTRMLGLPVLPIVPTAIVATLIEIPVVLITLSHPPIKRTIMGVAAANLASALIAFAVLAPRTYAPPQPGASEDIAMSRAMLTIKSSVETYHSQFGYYPESLAGGAIEGQSNSIAPIDPLLQSGILKSYPENPFGPYLRSHRLNLMYLLTGVGLATRPVSLDDPSNSWETRWFPLMRNVSMFGTAENILCANGLCEIPAGQAGSGRYFMNGSDYVPGCFFYQAYDFDNDKRADDYVLGMYGWPIGYGTTDVDLIDGRTGEISLTLDSRGNIQPGDPDGQPEAVFALSVGGSNQTGIL